ncbi:MAG: branched-chain amino acid ABC transporter permease [Peptococcaceae bacterium]|nr:MAG: branched-chain amino acid ABC transporter permease [Peptococcaceae bacterium]
MAYFFQILVGGLAEGSVYALIALGFVLIYKASGVLNFAQGEFMMVGAYFAFFLIEEWKLPFALGVIIALALAALLGLLLNGLIFQRMIDEPILSVIMVTIGLASFMRSVSGFAFNLRESTITSPVGDSVIHFGGVTIWELYLWTIIIALVLFGFFSLFFRYTYMGLGMRAAAENQESAQLMGISIKGVFGLSLVIASVVAAIGGIFSAQLTHVSPEMYLVGLRALPAAFLGGIDSIPGVIVGGLILGVIEGFAGGYISGGAKEVVAFVMLFIILLIKPHGLFGTKEIKRV